MALIGMACYSTEENKKDECLDRTLKGLLNTVDFYKHRLILSVNGFTEKTKGIIDFYSRYNIIFKIFWNKENIGTARAINKVWAERKPGENVVKMDDDIAIYTYGWLDQLEECVSRDPLIGQIGLKRKDCWENVNHQDPYYKSELHQLPHEPGQSWLTIEKANHIIGSCVLHSSALVDKCGGLFQYGTYGYDDVIYSWRTKAAGFYSAFLPHVVIDHIDPGDTPYQSWKEKHSGQYTDQVIKLCHDIHDGKKSYYYPFE